jgi:hypothetical protein
MQKSDNEVRIIIFLVVAVLGVWLYNGWRLQYVQPVSSELAMYSKDESLSNIKVILPSIVELDKDRLSKFYKAFATVMQNDNQNYVNHTSVLREINSRAGVLCFGDELMGKYPGLAEAIDGYLSSSAGVDKEHKTISSKDKENIINALNELSTLFKK